MEGLIEQIEEFTKSDRALVARTFVSGQNTFPVHIMNPSDEVKVINKDTVIGEFNAVKIMAYDNRSGSNTETKRHNQLKCILLTCLTGEQYQKAETLTDRLTLPTSGR